MKQGRTRMFCYISKNWQGQPLTDIEAVINLILCTEMEKELTIICQFDEKIYETGYKILDDELAEINIFHCETFEK